MANLHFHYGVMGSIKSTLLIGTAHSLRSHNKAQVEVIKPSFDTRFSASSVVSRMGSETPAMAMPHLDGYSPRRGTKYVLVDEVQFFSPADIDTLVRIAETSKIIVMCYGLMVDSNEHLFPASQRLIEVGAKLHYHETACQMPRCCKLATHHLRFDSAGRVIRQGEQFALGDSNYKSVCRKHYYELYHGIKTKG